MYYTGLGRLDASLAQILYTLYPIFLTSFRDWRAAHCRGSRCLRLALGLSAVYLLHAMARSRPIGWAWR